jgi:citrate lyase beta subunit
VLVTANVEGAELIIDGRTLGPTPYEGRMVDAAMARVARELLAEAGETAGAEGPAAR